jgi:Fe-S-cluster-containing hydrogenase component 2
MCPVEVLQSKNGAIAIDNTMHFGCIACGQCMMVCPNGSIAVTGRNIAPEDLLELPPIQQRATWEQLTALMLARLLRPSLCHRKQSRLSRVRSVCLMKLSPNQPGTIYL